MTQRFHSNFHKVNLGQFRSIIAKSNMPPQKKHSGRTVKLDPPRLSALIKADYPMFCNDLSVTVSNQSRCRLHTCSQDWRHVGNDQQTQEHVQRSGNDTKDTSNLKEYLSLSAWLLI